VALTNSGKPSGEPRACAISTFSGKITGKSFSGTGNDAVFFAVEHGDGRAPIALARDSPIFQAIGDGGFAEAILLGECGHLLDGFGALKAAVGAGIDQHAVVATNGSGGSVMVSS
jgi:hypothetical protein